jgi:hypothetical protein
MMEDRSGSLLPEKLLGAIFDLKLTNVIFQICWYLQGALFGEERTGRIESTIETKSIDVSARDFCNWTWNVDYKSGNFPRCAETTGWSSAEAAKGTAKDRKSTTGRVWHSCLARDLKLLSGLRIQKPTVL